MISNAQKKLIRSLAQKKYRTLHGLFVVEGPKAVCEFLKYQEPAILLTDIEDIRQVSQQQHPQPMLAVFPLPKSTKPAINKDALTIALDGVQDPGNLGTIIRIADWFGIRDIVCSRDTADAYNPKTVQATMGSLARINIHYVESLAEWLKTLPEGTAIHGTLLDGENIYTKELSPRGVIVMGNEGNGISPEVRQLLTSRLLIPSFSASDTAESLNVAIATAITCSEFLRGK